MLTASSITCCLQPLLTHLPPLPCTQVLGADGLIYQEVEDLVACGRDLNPDIHDFDDSCFTGGCFGMGALALGAGRPGWHAHPQRRSEALPHKLAPRLFPHCPTCFPACRPVCHG